MKARDEHYRAKLYHVYIKNNAGAILLLQNGKFAWRLLDTGNTFHIEEPRILNTYTEKRIILLEILFDKIS